MAERIVSPGVFTRENDLSFLAQGVGEIGAAFIGPFKQGPAFVPTIVRTQSEFEDIFNPSVYLQAVCEVTGMMISTEEFSCFQKKTGSKGSKFAKWSKVMLSIANSQSLDWAAIEYAAKTAVAKELAQKAQTLSTADLAWARAISSRITKYLSEN